MRFIKIIRRKAWTIVLVLLLLALACMPIILYFTVFEPPYTKIGELYWSEKTKLPLSWHSSTVQCVVEGKALHVVAEPTVESSERGIYYINSNDNGKTWFEPRQITDERPIGVPSMRLALFQNNIFTFWQGNEGFKYRKSNDNGQSWSQTYTLFKKEWLEDIKAIDNHIYVVAKEVTNGSSLYDTNYTSDTYLYYSTDMGENWNKKLLEFPIQSPIIDSKLELFDGKLLLHVEYRLGDSHVNYSFPHCFVLSSDNGNTWEMLGIETKDIDDFIVVDDTIHSIKKDNTIYYRNSHNLKEWGEWFDTGLPVGDWWKSSMIVDGSDVYLVDIYDSFNYATNEFYSFFKMKISHDSGNTWGTTFSIFPTKYTQGQHWSLHRRIYSLNADNGLLHMIGAKQSEANPENIKTCYSHTITKEEAMKLKRAALVKKGVVIGISEILVAGLALYVYFKKVRGKGRVNFSVVEADADR